MRGIKYRVWDGEKMHHADNEKYHLLLSGELIYLDGYWDETWDGEDEHRFWIDETCKITDVAIQQFTGLLDSEGKEIFEEDIIEFHMKEGESFPDTIFTGLIEFSEFYTDGPCQVGDIVLGWNIKVDDECRWSLLEIINDDYHFHNLKIIGNIYESPKLLQP